MSKPLSNRSRRHTWTYADHARLLDDGNRYEVIDGEVLVTPGPSPHHQHVLKVLLRWCSYRIRRAQGSATAGWRCLPG